MIWLFERQNELVRLETRFDKVSEEYVIGVAWADHPSQTERFAEFAQFHARILALEHQLGSENWTQVGAPTLIPDGWRGP